MQQSQALQFYYQAGLFNQDGGGPATHPANPSGWLQQDNTKNNQYSHQWDNNGAFHVTGTQYGAGQVQGGGGQNRVPVPQQPQTSQQPPPTSNTPPGIHGEMNKQPLMPNQPAQFAIRGIPNPQGFAYQRGGMAQPPQSMRPHSRQAMPPLYQIVTPAPAPGTITTQVLQYPVMYNAGVQPRQNAPYPGGQQLFMQQQYYNPSAAQTGYFSAVIPAPQYQGMSSGGPSPQAAGQATVPLMRPNMVPNTSMAPPPSKQEPKKRPNAIKIINPESGVEVVVENENNSNNNNITPTRSNDSSARETPQPNSGITPDNNVAADFAARVAAAAGEPTTPAQPPPEQPRPPELTSPSDSDHKQSNSVPTSEKPFSTTVLSMASEEFIPRSHKQQLSEPTAEEPVQLVPTVSAETNSPAIELQRPKEFPSLKNTPPVQSPARGNSKKKGNETATVPQPQPENKKAMRGNGLKEELPKEKREKTRSVSKEPSPAPSPVVAAEVSSQSEAVAVVKTVPPAPIKEAVRGVSVPLTVVEIPDVNKSQQQNGETAVPEPSPVALDGSKAARQKTKSNKKMREQLNRKGVDKEGSDMDAFTDTSIVSEEKERPSTPLSPPSVSPPPPAPATIEPPQSLVDKIKEDLEEKEDKQEKLVAAKNEENTKVSALSEEDKAEPPVIEQMEEKKPPQLTLRHSYRKDQWSPLNPEGKKKYERDFLIELKSEPQSNVKPDNLPDVVAVIRDSSNMSRNNQSMNFMNNRADVRGLLPDFIQRNSPSQRGPQIRQQGRGSQQGNKKQNPKAIHMSLSLHEDVKLKTAENAWKPHRLEADAGKNDVQRENEKLYKEVRGILNKLTPQKFDTLMKKFMHLPINSEERLVGVIHLIFDKAVDEPNFSKAYANMCKICSKMEVSKVENGQEQKVNFRKILITRCQTEFESNKSSELDAAKWLEEIKNCTDPEQKKELQLQYEEKERTIRRKSVGNIRFIGELFKLGMLTPAIMYRCIEQLLSTPEEESLECLCKLLTTIGKDLEQHQQKLPGSLNPYFQRMAELAQKREGSKVSSRVRFMLQDVIELRQNKWVPRREDNNPKTIEQITKEAERESMEMSIALQQQPPPRMNRQNDRQDDRKRNNRGGNNQSDNDGWVTMTPSSRYHSKAPAFEASKMQNMVKNEMSADLNSLSLGGKSQFIFHTNTSKSSMESKSGPVFTSNNVYSALVQDKKPPPQPGMNNRRLTPTPSIEKDKERQRMIQGAFESEGRNSRGSSMQRERPTPLSSQPSSRESSIPRQPDNKETEQRDKADDKTAEAAHRAAEEKLERQSLTIFNEYLAGLTTIEDVKQDVEGIFDGDKIGRFINKGLELSLEMKAGTQKRIGELFISLMDYGVFTTDVFVHQLSLIYEAIDDIAIDVPKVWDLQAQVIVPILASEKINFSHIKAACSPVLKTKPAVKLLVPLLTLLAEEKKPGFVRKVWDSSNVSLKDFLPPDVNVDAFIKDNSLEYLTGEPPQYEPSSESLLSMDEVQDKMIQLMQTNTKCDQIFQFISSNVGDKVESLQFIRALITAICTACITDNNYSLDLTRFKDYAKLIQRYVDNKEDRELASLSTVHILCNRHDHPQGLIKNIFNLFLECGLISSDSFFKWKDDDTEKLENKGVSLYALTSFFTALEDVESEDENS